MDTNGSFFYFEDLTPGLSMEIGTYKVSEEEIIEFAQKYDPQPFHVDREAAKESMFGGIIASGWHTASIGMRLYVDRILNNSTSLGSPGVDELRWKRPVRPGDVLSGKFTIIEAKPFRKGIGLIKGKGELYNQEKRLVMSFIGNGMFATKDADK